MRLPDIRAALEALIATGPLRVEFQPIVDLVRGEVRGYEVLGRCGALDGPLADPGRRGPGALLELAHQHGCLFELDRRWRELAVREIAQQARSDVAWFINVDPRAAEQPGFAADFTEQLVRDHGLEPAQFVLELTEAATRDPVAIQDVLAHYVLQGFRVALDDLGAEHQSFATLLRVRPSVVKLDGVLVRGIERDPSRQHLLATLAEFGRRSGIEVVAEGIETRAQLGAVLAAGITLAQGFLLGRPAPTPQRPAADILADLRARARTDRMRRAPEVAILALLDRLRGAAGALDPMLQDVTDLACELLDCDRASLRMLDDSRSRLLVAARTGKPIHEPIDPEFRVGEGLAGWVAAHRVPLLVEDAETDPRFVDKPGQTRRVGAFLGVPLLDAQGVIGVLAVTSSVGTFTATQSHWLQVVAGVASPYLDVARLRRIAVTDELTLAFNRRALDTLLPFDPAPGTAPSTALGASASDSALSVAVLDIDHFKAINDRLGHATGDEVLRTVRRLLASTLRRGDEIVRLGGDEFLLVLHGAAASDAQQIAERACRIVAGTPILAEPVTISGGVAERVSEESRDALLERADRALYRAKAAGRNRTVQG